MDNTCDHSKTEVLARRDGVDYVPFVWVCGQVFEAEDLEQVTVYDEELRSNQILNTPLASVFPGGSVPGLTNHFPKEACAILRI